MGCWHQQENPPRGAPSPLNFVFREGCACEAQSEDTDPNPVRGAGARLDHGVALGAVRAQPAAQPPGSRRADVPARRVRVLRPLWRPARARAPAPARPPLPLHRNTVVQRCQPQWTTTYT